MKATKDIKILEICRYFNQIELPQSLKRILKALCEEGVYENENGKIKIFYYGKGIYYGDLGEDLFEIENLEDLECFLNHSRNLVKNHTSGGGDER